MIPRLFYCHRLFHQLSKYLFAAAAVVVAAAAAAPLWFGLFVLDDDPAPEEENDGPRGERFYMPAVLPLAVSAAMAMGAICLVAKAVIGDGSASAAAPGRSRRAGRGKDDWRRARDFGTGR